MPERAFGERVRFVGTDAPNARHYHAPDEVEQTDGPHADPELHGVAAHRDRKGWPVRFTRSTGIRIRLVLALLLVAAGALAGVTMHPPRATAQPASVTVTLSSISPVLTKGGTFEVRGTVANTGDVPIQTVTAAFWVSLSPLVTRRGLADAAAEAPGDRLGVRITEPEDLLDEMADSLAPGESATFSLKVPVERLGLGGPGVYPVGVDIRANAPNELRDTVGRLRTFAPYLPDPAASGTVDVAYVVPFTSSPTAVADGSLLTSSLADDVAPGGRLARLLSLASKSTVTPAIDPNLLAEATTLAGDHSVRQPVAGKVPGNSDAAAFVAGIKGLVAGRKALILPFADTDLVSLDHLGLTEPLTGLAALSAAAGAASGLTGPVTAMPAQGYADASALDTIAAAGIRRVVLSAATLPDLAAGTPAVSIPTNDGVLTAIVTDPGLLPADNAPTGVDAAIPDRQRFLAETSLLALTTPKGSTYRVVAALPRDLDVTATTRGLLHPPAAATWVATKSLDAVTAGKLPRYTGTLTYPKATRNQELSLGNVKAVRLLLDRSAALVDIAGDRENAGAVWQRAALRGTSIAWRADPASGLELVTADADLLNGQLGRVSLSVPLLVTLTGSSGSFPVTVNNQLDIPVTVYIRITSPNKGVVDPGAVQKVEIDANRRVTSRFTANSGRGGVVRLTAHLVTSDGQPLGGGTAFTIRVTQYGIVGWVILGAGAVLLIAVGIYRQIRAHKRARATDPSDALA